MNRRDYLAGLALAATVSVAGCANRVGASNEEKQDDVTIERSDNGIVVRNLEVQSSGERSCYHYFEATVINENDHQVEDVRIEIAVVDENGQYLTRFDTGYVSMGPGESKPMEVDSGPQRNECWSATLPADYQVTASYKK